MKTGKQIKNIVLDVLSDGKEHTMTEIRDVVLSHNIKLDDKSTLLRNIMYHLKKENANFLNPTRGIYQLLPAEKVYNDYYSELNSAIKTVEKTLQEYKRFNWYSCSEEELEIARTKVKTLLKLANTITMELK